MIHDLPPANEHEDDADVKITSVPPMSSHNVRLSPLHTTAYNLKNRGTPFYTIFDDMLFVGETREDLEGQLVDWCGPELAASVEIYDASTDEEDLDESKD